MKSRPAAVVVALGTLLTSSAPLASAAQDPEGAVPPPSLRASVERLSLPAAEATVLRIGAPRRTSFVREGAILGAATAGAFGTLLVLSDDDADGTATGVVAALTGIGAAGGALAGTLLHRERGPEFAVPGDVVRVNGSEGTQGELETLGDGTLNLQLQDGTTRAIPVEGAWIEVRRSKRLHWVGALAGGVSFLAIGALIASCGECEGGGDFVVQATAFGATLGGLAGALVESHDWRDATPERAAAAQARADEAARPRFRVALGPTRDRGVRGQLSISWR